MLVQYYKHICFYSKILETSMRHPLGSTNHVVTKPILNHTMITPGMSVQQHLHFTRHIA